MDTSKVNVADFQIGDINEDMYKQASLYQYYGELAARALEDRDRCESRIKIMEADKELALRKNPPEGVKITEGWVKASIAADREIQRERDNLITREAELSLLTNAVRAMDQRGKQIDNIIRREVSYGYNSKDGDSVALNAARLQLNSKR